MNQSSLRVGVDFGGTKIEIAAIDAENRVVFRKRTPTPSAYMDAIEALRRLVDDVEGAGVAVSRIGLGHPGSERPDTRRVSGSNTQYLNGALLRDDLEQSLKRPVRLANDADCFALAEARAGAGAGCRNVFGVIVGTGCGGGVVIDGRLLPAASGAGGEWGHSPLPYMTAEERAAPPCWCGAHGCMETWVSGPAIAADYARHTGTTLSTDAIATKAAAGDADAQRALDRAADRLGRGLASIVNVLDPDIVVLGGGVSNIAALYEPTLNTLRKRSFTPEPKTRLVKNALGDSAGVIGAAWLWD